MYNIKVVNKKRFYNTLVVIVTVVLIILFLAINPINVFCNSNKDYKVVYVKEGDTLWSLASKHYNNYDIRKSVYNIMVYNDMENASLYAGQKIKIPTSLFIK